MDISPNKAQSTSLLHSYIALEPLEKILDLINPLFDSQFEYEEVRLMGRDCESDEVRYKYYVLGRYNLGAESLVISTELEDPEEDCECANEIFGSDYKCRFDMS